MSEIKLTEEQTAHIESLKEIYWLSPGKDIIYREEEIKGHWNALRLSGLEDATILDLTGEHACR